MFQDPLDMTGHGYIAAIWHEFFELMFGGQGLQINCGQSASSTIAQQPGSTSSNNNNNNSTIVCEMNEGSVACIRSVLNVDQNKSNCPSLVNSDI